MLSIKLLDSKDLLKAEIVKNVEFIISNINFNKPFINIFMNRPNGEVTDYPRMFFILYTLSRLWKYDFLTEENKVNILKIFWSLYDKCHLVDTMDNKRFVQMYGMRFLSNINMDYTRILDNFKEGSYGILYSRPVAGYVFISTYNECELLKKNYEYSYEIYSNCVKQFEYWSFSNKQNIWNQFHYSELSKWGSVLPAYLVKEISDLHIKKIEKDLSNKNISSSGMAKSLEHFARVNDVKYFEKISDFLEKRNYKKFKLFGNPMYFQYEIVYCEDGGSQYICLDTNGHIINALLNIYERKD